MVGFVFDEPIRPPPVLHENVGKAALQSGEEVDHSSSSATSTSSASSGGAEGIKDQSAVDQAGPEIGASLPPTVTLAKEDAVPESAPPRRVMGPAMPSAAMLAAAALLMEEVQGHGMESDSDMSDGLMVGPPPPELVMEVEGVPQDEREAEVG